MNTELMNIYHTLDKTKQRVLQVNALAYNLVSERYYIGSSLLYAIGGLHKALLQQLAIDNGGRSISQRDLVLIVNQLTRSGFLNKEGECYPEFIYPLCRIAALPENVRANLAIISKIERFKFTPEFSSWRKFDIYDYRSIEHEDFRCLNIAIHTNNLGVFDGDWDNEQQLKIICAYRHLYFLVDLDEKWVKTRHPVFQKILCLAKLSHDLGLNLSPVADRDYWLAVFTQVMALPNKENIPLVTLLCNQLRMVFAKFETNTAKSPNKWLDNYITGTKLLLDSAAAGEALKFYDLSIREYSDLNKRDYWFWSFDAVFLYVIALIRDQKHKKIRTAVIARHERLSQYNRLNQLLEGVQAILENDLTLAINNFKAAVFASLEELSARELLEFAVYSWLQYLLEPGAVKPEVLIEYLKQAQKLVQPLAAAILSEIILEYQPDNGMVNEIYANSPYKGINIPGLIRVRASWEYTMDKLFGVLFSSRIEEVKNEALRYRRLAWCLSPAKSLVKVVEQNIDESGHWVDIKEIPLSRLARRIDIDFIEKHDSLALIAIEVEEGRKGGYEWNYPQLMLNLIGHPHLFDYDNPEQRIELVQATPELTIQSASEGYFITLSHHLNKPGVYVGKVNDSQYEVIGISEPLAQLSEIIDQQGLFIPAQARRRLRELLARSSPLVKINADITDEDIVVKPALNHFYVQFGKRDDGLAMTLFIQPFGPGGGVFYPGCGNLAKSLREDDGSLIQIARDFAQENAQVQGLIELCPSLATGQISQFQWVFPEKEQVFQLLAELENYKVNSPLTIEWLNGARLEA